MTIHIWVGADVLNPTGRPAVLITEVLLNAFKQKGHVMFLFVIRSEASHQKYCFLSHVVNRHNNYKAFNNLNLHYKTAVLQMMTDKE